CGPTLRGPSARGSRRAGGKLDLELEDVADRDLLVGLVGREALLLDLDVIRQGRVVEDRAPLAGLVRLERQLEVGQARRRDRDRRALDRRPGLVRDSAVDPGLGYREQSDRDERDKDREDRGQKNRAFHG